MKNSARFSLKIPLLRLACLPAFLLAALLLRSAARADVTIINDVYEGIPQFRIITSVGTLYYDKAGGGFSRLVDPDGYDWIAFHPDYGHDKNPGSAAAGWRGMPQIVSGDGRFDEGAGSPGYEMCTSTLLPGGIIRTVTKSGRWAWTWRFTDTHAIFTMEKTDGNEPWWFLYQGPVGGRFTPFSHFWGTSEGGPRHDTPDHARTGQDVIGQWRWVYLGDQARRFALVFAQVEPEPVTCFFSYFGSTSKELGIQSTDGMAILGFGRDRTLQPLLHGPHHSFIIGFVAKPFPDAPMQETMSRIVQQWTAPNATPSHQ